MIKYLVLCLILCGCGEGFTEPCKPVKTTTTKTLLTQIDNCKVFEVQIISESTPACLRQSVYFLLTTCKGDITWKETQGKSTVTKHNVTVRE